MRILNRSRSTNDGSRSQETQSPIRTGAQRRQESSTRAWCFGRWHFVFGNLTCVVCQSIEAHFAHFISREVIARIHPPTAHATDDLTRSARASFLQGLGLAKSLLQFLRLANSSATLNCTKYV